MNGQLENDVIDYPWVGYREPIRYRFPGWDISNSTQIIFITGRPTRIDSICLLRTTYLSVNPIRDVLYCRLPGIIQTSLIHLCHC